MNSGMARILITDTNYYKLLELRNALVKNKYEVFVADNSDTFYFLIRSNRFDLILLDLSIPDIDPLELVDSFNDGELYTAIICSGDSVKYDSGVEAVRRGAFDLLMKPYKADVLLRSVESALDNSAQIKLDKRFLPEAERIGNVYQYIIENSQDIHYVLDREGRFSYINKRVETLLGYQRADLLGKHYSEILFEEDLGKAKHRLYDKRRNSVIPRSIELRFKYKDNKEDPRYFEVSSTSVSHLLQESEDGESGVQLSPLDEVALFAVARDITEHKKIERIIDRKASYDHLTGLPNKTLFFDRFDLMIARAKRNQERFAIMFLDLDDFKHVNDDYGHHVGDNVLQAMSMRMQECLRESDTLARIGGDEFTLLLPQVNNTDEVVLIAEKLTAAINRSLVIGGKNHRLSVSIGIAIYPDNGTTRESLVHSADQAMYQTKHAEKNGYRFSRNATGMSMIE